jgi:hypothetical protein
MNGLNYSDSKIRKEEVFLGSIKAKYCIGQAYGTAFGNHQLKVY